MLRNSQICRMGRRGDGGDAIDPNNILLLRFEGSNGARSFTDLSNLHRAATLVGTGGGPVTSTAQAKFGTSSGLFTSANGEYMTFPEDANSVCGTGDYTAECFAYWTANPAAHTELFTMGAKSSPTALVSMLRHTDGKLKMYTSAAGYVIVGTTTITNNVWHHLAISRSGNNHKLWLDGVQEGSTWVSATACGTVGAVTAVGAYFSAASEYMNGYIDSLRITKGVCRYTGNFTPPVMELT